MSLLDRSIEALLKEPIDSIRRRTLWELRIEAETKHGGPMRFVSHFPFIGRGNVMRDRIKDHETVERELDEALKNL